MIIALPARPCSAAGRWAPASERANDSSFRYLHFGAVKDGDFLQDHDIDKSRA